MGPHRTVQTSPTCIPCILGQVLATARRVTSDEWLHRRVLVGAMELLQKGDFDRSPAEVVHEVLSGALSVLGNPDPWAEAREASQKRSLELDAKARETVRAAADPLLAAVRLSTAANAWDAMVLGSLDAVAWIEGALQRPFAIDEYEGLKGALATAGKVMVVLDNAGEVVFDRILIEQLAGKKITCVARRSPVYNDVTPAMLAGFFGAEVEVIDPGVVGMGLPLPLCTKEFRQRYAESDLVLAKGAANFETLEAAEGKAYFLLAVKCPRVAEHLRCAVGDLVLTKNCPKGVTQRVVKQATRVRMRKRQAEVS